MKSKNLPPPDPDTVMKRVLNTAGLEKRTTNKKEKPGVVNGTKTIKALKKVEPEVARRKGPKVARKESTTQTTAVRDRRADARKTTGRPQAPRDNRD